MTAFMQSIHKCEHCFDRKAEKLVFHHPYFAFFVMFLVLPIILLAVVSVCTTMIVLPLALIFGWL